MKKNLKLAALVLAAIMMMTTSAMAFDWDTATGVEFPLKESAEYTYMIPENPNYKLIQDGEIMEYFREKTGIRIVFQPVPNENYNEKYNITMGSGNLPDIVTPRQAYMFGPQGMFLNLADYSEYTPNFNKLLEEHPEYKSSFVCNDGGIYHMATVMEDPISRIQYCIMYREDIIQELGMEVPSDEEGWYNLLKAVKQAYPDMVPFCFPKDDWRFSVAFAGYYLNDNMRYDFDTGKWVYSPATENYKAALTFANKLYTEGLLDQEFLSLTKNDMDQKFYSGQLFAGITHNWGGSSAGMNKKLRESGDEKIWLGETAPWGTPFGQRFIPSSTPVYGYDDNRAIAFSANIKNPEAVIAYFDYVCYSQEGALTQAYGIEGKHWTMTEYGPDYLGDQVQMALNGESSYTVLGGSDRFPRITAANIWYKDAFKTYNETVLATDIYSQHRKAMLDKLGPFVDSRFAPNMILFMDADQLERVSELKTLLNTIFFEYRTALITGRRPMSDWDEMVAQLKSSGYEELVEIYNTAQAAFDAINK